MGFDSREMSFSDTRVKMLGIELDGLRGLIYKKSQPKEPVYGQGNNPKSIQRGQKKYEGQLMLLKSDFDKLNRAAKAAGYEDIVDVPASKIDITCVYQQDEDATGVSTDFLGGCEFTEYEDGLKTGDLFKEISLPIVFLKLVKS
jgi:hypothetical protein